MNKKNRRLLIKIISAFILVVIILIFGLLIFRSGTQSFDYESNKLLFSEHRFTPKYSLNKISENENYTTFKVVYDSKPFLNQKTEIHGLLYMPKTSNNVPGVLFLPGGGIIKENEPAAKAIANLGYAVLVIDQRGLGETGGFYPNYDQDRLLFIEKRESVQHLGVYDAIRGLDTLHHIRGIDDDNLVIAGSSMGGRYAIITASLYPKLNGAIIISSSGFDVESNSNPIIRNDPYFLSLDPDRYLMNLSPTKISFIHSITDDVINITVSAKTFSLASYPKSFYAVNNCSHGYCKEMLPYIKKELENMTS